MGGGLGLQLPAWRVMFYEMSKYVYLAGVMVAYSYTEQSLMTLLGGWYLWRQIYGQKPPLPPPGVDAGPALPAPGVTPCTARSRSQMIGPPMSIIVYMT